MTSKDVSEALRALATGDDRPETARLRDIIDDVEEAILKGVKREAIVQTLNERGFKMNLKSFESALYRIRLKRREDKTEKKKGEVEKETATGNVVDAQEQSSSDDADTSGLSAKQRRERHASKFVDTAATNPLIKRIKEKS